MSNERERVISITRCRVAAFIARQPQPVLWLREQIRAEAAKPGQPQAAQTAAA